MDVITHFRTAISCSSPTESNPHTAIALFFEHAITAYNTAHPFVHRTHAQKLLTNLCASNTRSPIADYIAVLFYIHLNPSAETPAITAALCANPILFGDTAPAHDAAVQTTDNSEPAHRQIDTPTAALAAITASFIHHFWHANMHFAAALHAAFNTYNYQVLVTIAAHQQFFISTLVALVAIDNILAARTYTTVASHLPLNIRHNKYTYTVNPHTGAFTSHPPNAPLHRHIRHTHHAAKENLIHHARQILALSPTQKLAHTFLHHFQPTPTLTNI